MALIRPKDEDIAALTSMVIDAYRELNGNNSHTLLSYITLNREENGFVLNEIFFQRYPVDLGDTKSLTRAYERYHRDLTDAIKTAISSQMRA